MSSLSERRTTYFPVTNVDHKRNILLSSGEYSSMTKLCLYSILQVKYVMKKSGLPQGRHDSLIHSVLEKVGLAPRIVHQWEIVLLPIGGSTTSDSRPESGEGLQTGTSIIIFKRPLTTVYGLLISYNDITVWLMILSSVCSTIEKLHSLGYRHNILSLHNIIVEETNDKTPLTRGTDNLDLPHAERPELDVYISKNHTFGFINFYSTTTHHTPEELIDDYDLLLLELNSLKRTTTTFGNNFSVLYATLFEYVRNRRT